MKYALLAFAASTALLSACSDGNDAAEDRMEAAAERSAVAAGNAEAALGLTEAQLLDAELVGPNDVELGDVESIVRGANNEVEQLLIEIEDSNPDRFVHVPIADLSPVRRGDDVDLSTAMTAEQLSALPDAPLR